ncbi:FAD-dependent monooxygenase [Amycolatopsis sp.]|uniref:FAD-dependent monooxygenase n=1 Tax=Amycolatopsis sp. TaxID=37632 RepID=UPI002D8035EB|nr:FAD-dependent monooxygenase [Amycolatopsis sp.]HET6703794.1 FAD-dependent monooxygenase [Amycolatopsis sp.]
MSGEAIVIGGGIGGLAAAVALDRIGWRATVLERTAVLGEIGAGMSQAPNALRALDELGVQARSAGVPTYAAGTLRTPDGRYLQRARPGDTAAMLAFHRADLHRALLDATPDGWVRTGVEVTDLRQEAGHVTVVTGEEELTADLVVAADGIRSTARRLLWPDAPPPRFLGRTAWLGIADVADLPGSITLGPGGYFLIHPVARGRAYWAYVTTESRPGVRYDDEKTEVTRRVGAWHDPIPELIGRTPPGSVIHIDIHDLDPLPSYVQGRVALLGDAAHAMSPDRGQGAGQSIEDTVVLAAALATEPTIEAALHRYDADRRPRTQATARGARKDGDRTTSRAAYRTMVTMIRLMPAALWRKSIAPDSNATWRWEPPRLPART